MAAGTIYLKETTRSGEITWEVVVCPACLAEHKQLIEMRRGETRVERPYVGEPRECTFCEDAADAAAADACSR